MCIHVVRSYKIPGTSYVYYLVYTGAGACYHHISIFLYIYPVVYSRNTCIYVVPPVPPTMVAYFGPKRLLGFVPLYQVPWYPGIYYTLYLVRVLLEITIRRESVHSSKYFSCWLFLSVSYPFFFVLIPNTWSAPAVTSSTSTRCRLLLIIQTVRCTRYRPLPL